MWYHSEAVGNTTLLVSHLCRWVQRINSLPDDQSHPSLVESNVQEHSCPFRSRLSHQQIKESNQSISHTFLPLQYPCRCNSLLSDMATVVHNHFWSLPCRWALPCKRSILPLHLQSLHHVPAAGAAAGLFNMTQFPAQYHGEVINPPTIAYSFRRSTTAQ